MVPLLHSSTEIYIFGQYLDQVKTDSDQLTYEKYPSLVNRWLQNYYNFLGLSKEQPFQQK